MSRSGLSSNCVAFKPCSRQEIERRMDVVVAEVSSPIDGDPGSAGGTEDFRWIAPAELVRRMRPFLVFN